MRFFLMVLSALIITMVIYYVTWMLHVLYGIFGKEVGPVKSIIPFYGWVKWTKGVKPLIIIGLSTLLISCAPVQADGNVSPTPHRTRQMSGKLEGFYNAVVNKYDTNYDVVEFTYGGHSYIWFAKSCNSRGYAGVVHNPDCACGWCKPVVKTYPKTNNDSKDSESSEYDFYNY